MKFFMVPDSVFLQKFIQILRREMVPLEIIDVNGNRYSTGQNDIKYRLCIRNKKFFKALAYPDAFRLGEAYVNGYFDIQGNIKELYEMVCSRLLSKDQKKSIVGRFASLFKNSAEKEKENIEYHYDVPSRFYEIFLGKTMGYTCGYYAGEKASMDEAQIDKMDIICRKLDLKPKDTLLDIGCGWGNFAVHAAKHYGVKVTGITLSREQKAYAEQWAASEKLSDRIEIRIMNYRDLGENQYDKVSCVGMSEHVGRKNMAGFYGIVCRCLKKGGLFMQHTITTNYERPKGYENSFLDKYMFPGGELLFEHDLVRLAESKGFELINAENFRPHYVKTLNDWITRMEDHRERLLEIVSEHVYRIYHVFFIGSLISFRQKEISLYQNLFYKTDETRLDTEPFKSAYAVK